MKKLQKHFHKKFLPEFFCNPGKYFKMLGDKGEVKPSFVLLLLAVLVLASFWSVGWRPFHKLFLRWPPGTLAAAAPTQLNTTKEWKVGDATFHALATFEVNARLLMNVPYTAKNDEFKLSPMDLVVGWGPLSNSTVLTHIEFGHSYRYVSFMSDTEAIESSQIGQYLSHIHAIPANPEIQSIIEDMSPEDIIYMYGYLVSVDMPGFYSWTSSLSRLDSGCEIMWIEKARVATPRPSFLSSLLNNLKY